MNSSEYASHPLRNLLERLTELRKSTEFTDPDLLSNDASATALETTFATVAVVCSMLERTPALLVSEYGLTQLQNSFQSIFNELTHYQSNRNHGHIQNAKAQIEQVVMSQLWAFGPIPTAGDFDQSDLVEVVNQATQTARDAVRQLVVERDSLRTRQMDLTQQVLNAEAKLESLSETVAKQKAEAVSVVAVVQQMYAEKEAERVAAFSTMLQDLRADFSTLQTDSEKTQSERLDALRTSQEEAARIVQVVGNTGITGNYQKIANVEGAQADIWRWMTIAFFSAGIVIAVATFWKFWHEPFSPETAWSVLIRLMYAIVIATPAWYTAKESARHRSSADRARQTELELASLGPFIELMPDDRKHQIREELTKRYFGNQPPEHTAEPPISIQKLSDLAIELMKAAKK
ncbi:hypothetical protein [Acidovorax radicis]|uniref:hypothetical protein n=1 Tax=Acidovorax radicis TaxID=758826 RepID=UPI001CF903EC|nr:hypothetical protein [Acidovorax radicis]UCU99428.1 hypothetical protein KI609_01020 [Acidovorax radicis]